MTRALTVLALLVVLLAVYALMYSSWARRRRRHPGAALASAGSAAGSSARVAGSAAGAPEPVDADTVEADTVEAEGVYVSTVSDASSFDRVTAAGLGARSRARMVVTDAGVRWEREGAPAVVVPADRVLGAGRSTGMAGKVTGRPMIVAVAWRGDDDAAYETGFLPRHRADADRLLAAAHTLLTDPRTATPASATPTAELPTPTDGPT